jgi:hypothetical protein
MREQQTSPKTQGQQILVTAVRLEGYKIGFIELPFSDKIL